MQVHSNATTHKKQRTRIRQSDKTCRALAQEMAVSPATAHRWKHRDSPEEKSCRPHAIDRATLLSYLWVYEHKDKKAATDFLEKCQAFFPFKVSKILTDNGREFSLKGFKNRYGTAVKAVHDFERVCQEQQIEHRTTLPYTPKTNGMVERMNGLIRSNRASRYQRKHDQEEPLRDGPSDDRRSARLVRALQPLPQGPADRGKTPYEAVLAWYEKDPGVFIKEPTTLLAYRS
jgi:hypothetical protein